MNDLADSTVAMTVYNLLASNGKLAYLDAFYRVKIGVHRELSLEQFKRAINGLIARRFIFEVQGVFDLIDDSRSLITSRDRSDMTNADGQVDIVSGGWKGWIRSNRSLPKGVFA